MKIFLDKEKNKKGLIGLGVFILYIIVSYTKGMPLQLLGLTDLNESSLLIYSLFTSILLTGIIILIYFKGLKESFEDLKKNHKVYFKKYLRYWFIALGLMMFTNLILLAFLPNELPNNEELIRAMFSTNPVIVFMSAVFIAPILEELVFRKSFREIFNDKLVFIFMTSLTFGAFHVIGTAETFMDLFYIIPYSAPGIVFSIALLDSENIFVPIGLHFLHNGVLMSLQFIILLFS